MPQCVVIADDLTGANATGVLLKKMNYKAYTVMNTERIELSTLSDCDCVLYPTDSRGVDAKIAYNRVYNVCNLLKDDDVKVYANRIDSTLRGNLGSETDAMLDSLGEDYIAIVAPCFPASGRIICGGYMLVDGLPLHKTNIAVDPKTPVKISEVGELFKQQSKYQVSTIYMKDLMHGKHYLANLMKKCVEEGSRIITLDCITQEDLDLIADAVITSGLKVIAVDFSTSTGYPEKTAIQVTNFLPANYGPLVAKLAVTEKGRMRSFDEVLMICNQVDYLNKIMPATTTLTTGGTYARDLFPFPTEVVRSNEVKTGQAILCLPEEYFFGLGESKDGKIEYSDEFKFIQDARTYKIKLHGNGRPYDNTVAIVLDISKLDPAYVVVKTAENTVVA